MDDEKREIPELSLKEAIVLRSAVKRQRRVRAQGGVRNRAHGRIIEATKDESDVPVLDGLLERLNRTIRVVRVRR